MKPLKKIILPDKQAESALNEVFEDLYSQVNYMTEKERQGWGLSGITRRQPTKFNVDFTDGTLKVWDENKVLRVHIGNLDK